MEEADIIVDRKQFVITNFKYSAPSWRLTQLPCGNFFCWSDDLTVERIGKNNFTIGHQIGAGLAGRYVELLGSTLQHAHGGLLNVFYGAKGNRRVITSSPNIALKLLASSERTKRPCWGRGINWYASPGSPVCGVSRLMADQKIDILTHRVLRNIKKIIPNSSIDEGASNLSEYLTNFYAHLPSYRLNLFLTAGLDSRVLLASLLASGAKFKAITLRVSTGSDVDIRVARELSARYGFDHEVIEPRGGGDGDLRKWMLHTRRSVSDADDNLLIPGRQYRTLGPDDAVIRGGCFELGRAFYRERFRQLPDIPQSGKSIADTFGRASRTDEDAADLDAWLNWRLPNQMGLSIYDSFYLDQRIGGWLASIEQGLDIFPFLSVNPGNSDTAFSAVMSYGTPEEARRGDVQKAAARKMCPTILDLPINPRPIHARIRSRMKGELRRLKGAVRDYVQRDGKGDS